MNEEEHYLHPVPKGSIGCIAGLYYKVVGVRVFYWNEEWKLSGRNPDEVKNALKMKVKRRVSRYCIGY